MVRKKKVISALLGLMALSVVVRCGDHHEDEEGERRTRLSANTHVQETQRPQASASDVPSPNTLYVKASALLIKAVSPADPANLLATLR